MHLRPLRSCSLALFALFALTPFARAVDRLYLPSGDVFSNTVSVVEPATNSVLAVLTVGDGPRGVTLSPDRRFAYVANQYSNSISVIATATDTVVATVPVGDSPVWVAVKPDGSRLYVSNYGGSSVSVIAVVQQMGVTSFNVIATIPLAGPPQYGAGPIGILVDPAGTRVYVANWSATSISVINTATNTVIATIPLAFQPVGLAIDPNGSRLYSIGIRRLYSIDTTSLAVVAELETPMAFSVSVSSDGSRVYIASHLEGLIKIVDTATNTLIASIPVDSAPYGSLNASGTRYYLAGANGGHIQALDTTTLTVTSSASLVPDATQANGNGFVVERPCQGIAVAPAAISFAHQGGVSSFVVIAPSDCKWAVAPAATWLTTQPLGGFGSKIVTVYALPNRSLFPRSAPIVVSGDGGSAALTAFQF